MELRDIEIEDLAFYESMLCDPIMMAELGGPLPRGQSEKVRSIVDSVLDGSVWYYKIMPDDAPDTPAGTVCIWEHTWNGKSISEIGWMVLPAFQGRGLASEAVRSVLDKARSEARWDLVHAFPATSNGPSNAICRMMGFSKIEELDYEYAGRILRCNHWRVDLRPAGPAGPA